MKAILVATTVLTVGLVLTAQVHDAPPASGTQASSVPPGQAQIPRVARLSDLDPKTPEEIERAKHFDLYGDEPLTPGRRRYSLNPTPIEIWRDPRTPAAPEAAYELRLSRFVCEAEAVPITIVKDSRVLFNIRRTFMFTDFEMKVQTWIRPAETRESIIVSQPGGEAYVGSRRYGAEAESRKVLDLNAAYLLLLKRIGRTDSSYVLLASPVELKDDRALVPADWPRASGATEVTQDTFVEAVRSALTRCSK